MKGFIKNLFTIGVLAGVGYVGFKGYKRVSDIIKLSKTLPDYLNDLLEEKPKIEINMKLNSLSIAVGMTAETYDKINFNLDDQIKTYVVDYYPSLSKLKILTTKYIKSQDNTDENEDIVDQNDLDDNIEV